MPSKSCKIIILGDPLDEIFDLIKSIFPISRPNNTGEANYTLKTKVLNHNMSFHTWFISLSIIMDRVDYIRGDFQNPDGVIVIFDLCEKKSFQLITQRFDEIISHLQGPNISFLLIGNSADECQNGKDEVSESEIFQFLNSYKHPKVSHARFLRISINQRSNTDMIIPNLIPNIMDAGSICYNCLKVFDNLLFKKGFYFCEKCFGGDIDLEKANAFFRLNG